MAKPSGEIIETPITSNFREGLSVLQYFASTHGARKGLADTALKTANSGYLTRRLVDVAQDGIIREIDCGSTDGMLLTSRIEAGEIVEHVSERVMGRSLTEDIVDKDGKILFARNHLFVEKDKAVIIDNDVDQIKVRSVLTCNTRHGFCARCFGRDLARGGLVCVGETVGVIAAQSIGEPGTQLTMRTFHIGGAATAGAQVNKTEVKTGGKIKLENVKLAKSEEGKIIITNKVGEIIILDEDTNKEKERYPAVYGSTLFFKEKDIVKPGDKLLEWDPYSLPIFSEVKGKIKYEDMVLGETFKEQVDAVTGLTHRVITEPKDNSLQPRVIIVDSQGNPVKIPDSQRFASYRLPVGANLVVQDGDPLDAGGTIAKVQRESTKTKDITGGLPRVAELFEARKPNSASQIADVNGIIEFGSEVRGSRRIIIKPTEENMDPVVMTVPKGRYVIVNEGDYVRAGDAIMDGPNNPHDILRVLGVKALARYIVDEIQEVYRLQGVKIDDKHIEVITSQMLKKVEITDPGDSLYVPGDQVTKADVKDLNDEFIEKGLTPIQFKPLLLGITKASLTTDSFISAASFQETTKVLTQATLEGKRDSLRGLKENVIMGRLIPAGTGLPLYRGYDAKVISESGVAPTKNAELTL
jgi:DNA-directed RNA polymerase subunit beta'